MQLPDAGRAQVDAEKITDYLLSANHPNGRPKAEFFTRIGFRAGEWSVLKDALLKHGATQRAVRVVESRYGIRYIVKGLLELPSGRNPMVRSVRFITNEKPIPRLITAYPI